LAGAWWTLGLMAVAAVVLSAAPGLAASAAQTWGQRSGTSLLACFVALVCVPVAVVILFIMVIDVPLALMCLLLYVVLLPMGYLCSAIGLGQWGPARWRSQVAAHLGWRIGATCLALVLLALLGAIPGSAAWWRWPRCWSAWARSCCSSGRARRGHRPDQSPWACR
jgi:hypothetical protein